MTIVSVSIHAKLHSGIVRVAHLADQLSDESVYVLTDDQRGDVGAMIDGVNLFRDELDHFPDFSTQTPEQLTVLRHDLRNHLNLINGFAFVFVRGLGGELPEPKINLANQIHLLSKGLIGIVNRIA